MIEENFDSEKIKKAILKESANFTLFLNQMVFELQELPLSKIDLLQPYIKTADIIREQTGNQELYTLYMLEYLKR